MSAWDVMDFASGILVHATAGTAVLVCAVMVGRGAISRRARSRRTARR